MVNAEYFINGGQNITNFIINIAGFISSLIQIVLFLSVDDTNKKVTRIDNRMNYSQFPSNIGNLREKYKHLTDDPEYLKNKSIIHRIKNYFLGVIPSVKKK